MAIAVKPRLLGDALSRALRADGVDIEVFGDVAAVTGRFDVVVVTDGDDAVEAAVVVRLPAGDEGDVGSVTTVHGTEAVALGDLARVTELLDRFLPVA